MYVLTIPLNFFSTSGKKRASDDSAGVYGIQAPPVKSSTTIVGTKDSGQTTPIHGTGKIRATASIPSVKQASGETTALMIGSGGNGRLYNNFS